MPPKHPEKVETPNFIAAITALGATHGQRADEFGVVKRTIERIIVQHILPDQYARLVRHPDIAYALYLDAVTWQAKHSGPKKRNGRKNDPSA